MGSGGVNGPRESCASENERKEILRMERMLSKLRVQRVTKKLGFRMRNS